MLVEAKGLKQGNKRHDRYNTPLKSPHAPHF